MAIRKIAQMGEPILRQTAKDVTPGELESGSLQSLIQDMIETMRDADGAGLAAPQVYVGQRICVLEVQSNSRYPEFPNIPLSVLINPQVTPLVENYDVLLEKDSITMYEGCLSVPGLRGQVTRPRRVRVQALSDKGAKLDFAVEGIAAAIVQHEVDHLYGTLFIDRAQTKSLCFQKEFERYVPKSERVLDGHGGLT